MAAVPDYELMADVKAGRTRASGRAIAPALGHGGFILLVLALLFFFRKAFARILS